jgi:glutathione S-transferase
MLTVHHLGVSQSERIVWLCEELAIPYELKLYDRDPVTRMGPPEYKALHPMGQAPIVTDGDLVLPESGAIIDYIIAKYGDGRLAVPPGAANFADYLYWFHFSNATFLPRMMTAFAAPKPDQGEETPRAKAMRARTDQAWDLVEARLGQAEHFAGEFTAADIMMLFPLTTMRAFLPRDLTPFPNVRAYLQRIGERPAYRSAMAKGDPTMAPMLN